MNQREKYLNYIKNGGSEPFVSLQIGAGAGFDCKLAGKEWISDGNLNDTLDAYEIVDCDALINLGMPAFDPVVGELRWQFKTENTPQRRMVTRSLPTPYGVISVETQERPRMGVTPLKQALTIDDGEKALDIASWYAQQFAKAAKYVPDLVASALKETRGFGPVCFQWNVQPFELLGLASVDNLVLLAMSYPERYRKVCDVIRDVNVELVKAVFQGGADFIFLGSPGSEMISPQIYDDYIIPDSTVISKAVHEAGGLVYSHICSLIEPFLTRGYYNRMGIDLFETLSPPPVGNVPDLGYARKILDSNICTRGNLGLDVLLEGSAEDVERATEAILDATAGSKHILAASDYLFYDIPLENVKAMVRTAKSYRKKTGNTIDLRVS